MKIIVFQGGLGNQLFQYAYYRFKKNEGTVKVHAVYSDSKNHNGFEISNYFHTDDLTTSLWTTLIYKIVRFFYFHGINISYGIEGTVDCKNRLIEDGYWQDIKYYHSEFIHFKDLSLSKMNNCILEQIKSSESIAIHIRRGDYLKPQFVHIYGNVCTEEYYKKALEIVKKTFSNPKFFIFSDDIEWVKENLNLDNAVYVTHNRNKDSFFDMYLMAHCQANIIANSTFSYWGAYLNKRARIIIYPSKWFNSTFEPPIIFPSTWINL